MHTDQSDKPIHHPSLLNKKKGKGMEGVKSKMEKEKEKEKRVKTKPTKKGRGYRREL